MSIFSIFLIVIAFWIIRGLVRGFLFINRAQKNARNMYEQMFGGAAGYGAGEQEPSARRNKPGWSQPAEHRKKIDPNVGEYVKFQEISVTEEESSRKNADGSTTTSYTVEQQVTDAEWEDIPVK